MGEALAAELAACGIRWDFAPVVDVDTNPKNPVIGDRSFGDDPDLVGRLGAAHDPRPPGAAASRPAPSTSRATGTPTSTRTSTCPW